MESSAVMSDCGRYRYRLSRTWDASSPPIVFVMLNPSTADAETDDPTIRRCLGYTRRWGYGCLIVVNLYAYRTTRPGELWRVDDPVGNENDDHIRAAFDLASASTGLVVAAWGAHAATSRAVQVSGSAPSLTALALTKQGQPRHPLYIRKTAVPFRWTPAAMSTPDRIVTTPGQCDRYRARRLVASDNNKIDSCPRELREL